MWKISKIALLCYVAFIGLLGYLFVQAFLTTTWSHGTFTGNLMDAMEDFLRFHEERAVFFLLPVAGYLFQIRYSRLLKMFSTEKVNEFRFSSKSIKMCLAFFVFILFIYPLSVFLMLISAVGVNNMDYAYVGTINTVKDKFPPYNLLLSSEVVEEDTILFQVKLKHESSIGQETLVNDILLIMNQLNLYGAIGEQSDNTVLIEMNGAVRQDNLKQVVLDVFLNKVEQILYIEKVEFAYPHK
jgi:hypothetical protein